MVRKHFKLPAYRFSPTPDPDFRFVAASRIHAESQTVAKYVCRRISEAQAHG